LGLSSILEAALGATLGPVGSACWFMSASRAGQQACMHWFGALEERVRIADHVLGSAFDRYRYNLHRKLAPAGDAVWLSVGDCGAPGTITKSLIVLSKDAFASNLATCLSS
jgi:hypothetical protein